MNARRVLRIAKIDFRASACLWITLRTLTAVAASAAPLYGQEQSQPARVQSESVQNDALRLELLAMTKVDQAARIELMQELKEQGVPIGQKIDLRNPKAMSVMADVKLKLSAIDDKNRTRLKEIVDQYGWPGKSMVGKDGAQAAWLLAQHADADHAFQKKCLALNAGDAGGRNCETKRRLSHRSGAMRGEETAALRHTDGRRVPSETPGRSSERGQTARGSRPSTVSRVRRNIERDVRENVSRSFGDRQISSLTPRRLTRPSVKTCKEASMNILTPAPLESIASDLVRRGLPVEYAQRAAAELADHHGDLVAELRAWVWMKPMHRPKPRAAWAKHTHS